MWCSHSRPIDERARLPTSSASQPLPQALKPTHENTGGAAAGPAAATDKEEEDEAEARQSERKSASSSTGAGGGASTRAGKAAPAAPKTRPKGRALKEMLKPHAPNVSVSDVHYRAARMSPNKRQSIADKS